MSDQELEDGHVSRAQVKREIKEIADLGAQVANLPKSSRDTIPMDDDLVEAFDLADKIRNKREAWRRHLNLITKLLRNTDIEPIVEALEKINNRHHSSNVFFHKIESLRDRLISEGDKVVNEVISMNREIDRQKLRQLVRKAQKEQSAGQPPKAYRELFKYLRENLQEES